VAQKKPVTVLIFDVLFWCAFFTEAASIVEYVGNPGTEIASIRLAFSSSVCLLSSLILWYLASIQRLITSVALIGASIVVKMSLYIQLPSMYWSDFTWLSLHIFPLLLLVVAIGCMTSPSAAYWRRREQDLAITVFE
jgi:hypothetical protein